METNKKFFFQYVLTCQNDTLCNITTEQIQYKNYNDGINILLNDLLNIAIPNEDEKKLLILYNSNINNYIYINLCYILNQLLNALNIEILAIIRDVFLDLYDYMHETTYTFRIGKNHINWKNHDLSLTSFFNILNKYINKINIYGIDNAKKMIILYARCVFEIKRFRSPYKQFINHATNDVLSIITNYDKLWNETFPYWDLNKFI